MKPIHVLAYANYRIKCLEAKIEDTKQRYAAAKLAYEAKFLPKLFNLKYEDTFAGDTSWCGPWFSWSDVHMRNYVSLSNKARYCDKMEYANMQLPDDIDETSFYNWCNDNNIPY